jgi:hypothetical protein
VFPDGLWWGAAAVLAAYTLLFLLTRRPVSLRPRRLGCLVLVAGGLRLILLLCGYPLERFGEQILTGAVLLSGVALLLSARIWLLRVAREALREQIEMACRGLFLECKEPAPGDFHLSARGKTWRLRMVSLSRRTQLILLPRVTEPGKVALLVQWLSKQYPGPVPKIHIKLKKE